MLHAGVYLDPNADQELIAFLRPFALRRRTGHVIREALRMYLQAQRGGGLVAAAPAPSMQPSLFPPELSAPVAVSGETVIAKSRRAFFK